MADDAENERQSDRAGSDAADEGDEPTDGEEPTDGDEPTDGGPATDGPRTDGVDEPNDGADAESDGTGTEAADDEAETADDETETADDEASAGEDGQPDWSDGERFEASDLVAGGEYVGNDGDSVSSDGDDESPDRDGETAPEPPTETAPEPPADTPDDRTQEGDVPEPTDGDRVEPPVDESLEPVGESREPVDAELPEPPDGDISEPPDGEMPEPPDGEFREPPSDPDVYTPESEESGFSKGARQEPPEGYERPDNMAEATPIERKAGPPEDQEMPLADHVEEMVSRLFIIVAIAGVVSVAIFPFGEEIIDFLWYSVLPGGDVAQPRVYHPLALVMTQLKVASLGGLIVALPVFVYQTYAFMKPGLYPHERRYYLAAVPTSLVLAFVGITFAYFVILPAIFTYFLYYSDTVVTIAFALSDTFNLILLLMGYLAIVFQIPLFIMLAIMMGLVTRRWLENRRLYFWAAFLGISFIFNPDPTGMAPFLVTTTMITLFEGTLLLLRWTGR